MADMPRDAFSSTVDDGCRNSEGSAGLHTMGAEAERPVLLITTVDIGGGRSDKIELRQGDSALDAARAFCESHGIPTSVVGPLAEHIMDNLRKANLAKSPARAAAEQDAAGAVAKMQRCLEEPADAAPGAPPPQQSVSSSVAQKLSFADGMNDKLYKQLSAKLMPVDDAGGRLLSVSASLNAPAGSGNHAGGTNANNANTVSLSSRAHHSRASSVSVLASERGHRKSQSAEGSPRVHSRLYQLAQDLRHKQEARRRAAAHDVEASRVQQRSSMSWISQEMMRERTSGQFDNYGEMLYAEGLEVAAQRKARAEAQRAEKLAKELEGATFMPEITRLAAALWAGDDLDAQPAWQRLSANKRSKMLDRIREMKAAKELHELKECTFRPRINKQSAALMADRTMAQQALNLSAHEQLFADAMRRQQKMETLQAWLPEEATFKPSINKSHAAEVALGRSLEALGIRATSRLGPGAGGGSTADGSPVHVVDRLYLSMEKTKAKLEEKRAVLHGNVDPATGHLLYQPEVGRGPRGHAAATAAAVARNPSGRPIGEYLYEQGLEAQKQRDAALQAEKEAERAAASKPHSTAVSQRLFDKLRAKRFGQIFEYLDVEGAGLLDLVALVRRPTAHMDNLDNEVREDVESAAAIHAQASGIPLLPEPGQGSSSPGGQGDDEEDEAGRLAALPPAPLVDLPLFSALMEEALRQRRKPRAYLVPSPSTKQVPSHSFHPTINKRSRDLAARLRPAELAAHDVLHHTAEALRAKLEAARRDAEAQALAGCTFVPRLNPGLPGGGPPVEGRALRAARAAIAQGGNARQSHQAAPLQQQQQQQQASSGSYASPANLVPRAPPPPPRAKAAGAVDGSAGASSTGSSGAAAAQHAQQQQQRFAELEAQVHEALQGVNQATARLHALEEAPGGSSGSAAAASSAVAPAPRPGQFEQEEEEEEDGVPMLGSTAGASAVDLRATEAMLLDMLTSSPASLDTAADLDVINQLHRVLVAEAKQPPPHQAAQRVGAAVGVPTSLQGAAGAAHVQVQVPQGRRASKDTQGGGAVNLFVVPAELQRQSMGGRT